MMWSRTRKERETWKSGWNRIRSRMDRRASYLQYFWLGLAAATELNVMEESIWRDFDVGMVRMRVKIIEESCCAEEPEGRHQAPFDLWA